MSNDTRAMFVVILTALDSEIKTAEFEYMQETYTFRRNPQGVWLHKNNDIETGNWWLFC